MTSSILDDYHEACVPEGLARLAGPGRHIWMINVQDTDALGTPEGHRGLV